ncbi:MAG: TVP38/TMEM64 family protein [Alphaproteobacteria bacterium]
MNKSLAALAAGLPLRRLWPLGVLALAIVIFFLAGLDRYLNFDTLRQNRANLHGWVGANAGLAVLLFMATYACAIVAFPPSGAMLTMTGGFLFGTLFAGFYVVIAATIGATALFIVAKSTLGDYLRGRAGPFVKRMEAGFAQNALSYMLVLRLIPLFPFWLVNLAPAFLGVSVRTFVIGTFVGIIPGTFVYASVGAGLGAVFDTGGTPNIGIIFQPEILTPIIGLALLALLPIAYKKYKARRT